jgi:hypothetical protein
MDGNEKESGKIFAEGDAYVSLAYDNDTEDDEMMAAYNACIEEQKQKQKTIGDGTLVVRSKTPAMEESESEADVTIDTTIDGSIDGSVVPRKLFKTPSPLVGFHPFNDHFTQPKSSYGNNMTWSNLGLPTPGMRMPLVGVQQGLYYHPVHGRQNRNMIPNSGIHYRHPSIGSVTNSASSLAQQPITTIAEHPLPPVLPRGPAKKPVLPTCAKTSTGVVAHGAGKKKAAVKKKKKKKTTTAATTEEENEDEDLLANDGDLAEDDAKVNQSTKFRDEEVDALLDIMAVIKPIGKSEWEKVTSKYNEKHSDRRRTMRNLRNRFNIEANKKPPTGDPDCPPLVRKAKRINYSIKKKAGALVLGNGNGEEKKDEDEVAGDIGNLVGEDVATSVPLKKKKLRGSTAALEEKSFLEVFMYAEQQQSKKEAK